MGLCPGGFMSNWGKNRRSVWQWSLHLERVVPFSWATLGFDVFTAIVWRSRWGMLGACGGHLGVLLGDRGAVLVHPWGIFGLS